MVAVRDAVREMTQLPRSVVGRGRADWHVLRGLADTLTTPLHPDDYLRYVNPLWTARELRGRVEKVVRETDDAATLVIRPGWGWRFDHLPGQYVGIGVQVGGKFHWRSYSLTSTPRRHGRNITITIRAMPEGFLSDHLINGLSPGTIVRLASPAGEFVLPDPPPPRVLFLVGGSGITPIMAMLKTLDRRGHLDGADRRGLRDHTGHDGKPFGEDDPDEVRAIPQADVHLVYSSPTPDRMIFRETLEKLSDRRAGFTFTPRFTDTEGLLEMSDLDDVVPDWRERQTWACGPAPMLDAASEHWQSAGLEDALHLERFTLERGEGAGEGGTVSFQNSGKKAEADAGTTLLEAGESVGIGMPYGCRMGICHTCTLTLVDGSVVDVRNGDRYDQPNEPVQTCVTVPDGDCTLNI